MNHEHGNSGPHDGNHDAPRDIPHDEPRRGRRRGHGRHRRHRHRDHGFAAWARRKERVLHTRVSEDLHEALHRAAEDLRVPVSNLVRNVLEDVTRVVDGVSTSVGGIFETWIREARERQRQADAEGPRPERRDFSDVAGWQPIVVHRPGPCADCATDLERGDDAYLGVSSSGAAPLLLCRDCFDAQVDDAD